MGSKSYPRIVGETGGKDFVLAHKSADADVLATALIAHLSLGQNVPSAASRAYIPSNLAAAVKENWWLVKSFGSVEDFTNFISAVIDERSFDKIKSYIDNAKKDANASVWVGGECDKSKGYFIQLTIEAKKADYVTMCEEIFGPVLTVYIYDENKFEETLELVNATSPYALTGSIIAHDRLAVELATVKPRNAAGNFISTINLPVQ